ncbi:bile acid:sodium symporter family protein [Candidatus Pelagibacter sp.]|nr:bile acid:sodium symporter family protein [Candidatus Pelagibacter sp.]
MEIATKIAPLGLALIMLGLGLSLTVQDFLRVFKIPRDFLVGFICQLILLPVVAFIIIILLNPPAELAVGFMLIACAPGGVTSNICTKFANGDVALSITLTAVTSLISIITVPLIIFNSISFFEIGGISNDISMIGIALKMFFVVTVPVILGMTIRYFAKNFIEDKAVFVQRASIIIFAIVFIAIYISEWERIIPFLKGAGIMALILNLTMMFLAFHVAKYFASGISQQRCISLECGLQNGTLAAFVGTQIFGETGIMTFIIPAAAYVLVMMITSIAFILFLRRQS